MASKRASAAERRESRYLEEHRVEEAFFRRLERAASAEEVVDLAFDRSIEQRDPGYKFFQHLAYFVRFGIAPDGANAKERDAYRAMEIRLGIRSA
jgi:hypothetical protein